MAVKIRMARYGAKKNPQFRIVVADSECPRDGKHLEILGTYDPKKTEQKVTWKAPDRVKYWLSKGAKPSETIQSLLKQQPVA
ncbi:MAG: 30S ribosomal protein S16 [Deltaproteobacteria bacterium CG11_big_fil_rev_8_21_14_0_20_47_16]|nr:MAG: 30S ribosomal protein S16 [Deltaproteobacteria bacterium CG11_big_fil_rev_8_21_14_0_20_47_16]